MGQKTERSDDDLMRALQAGDTDAFELLVRRYLHRLSAFAESLTGDPSSADDIVQEAFIRVYEQRGQYIPMGRFRVWIYTIARNLCYDAFREPALRSLDLDMPLLLWSRFTERKETASPVAKLIGSERLNGLDQAVDRLPRAMREAVMFKYYHGLKAREIAEIQDCPIGTVKSRLHYALKRLERMVSD